MDGTALLFHVLPSLSHESAVQRERLSLYCVAPNLKLGYSLLYPDRRTLDETPYHPSPE